MQEHLRRVPQQERAQKSVDAILDATTALLGDGRAVTMSAIGEEAGISKAAIYRYYPNQSAVIRALGECYTRQVEQSVAGALEGVDNLEEALKRSSEIIDSFYQLMLDEPALRAIWITGFSSADLGSLVLETVDRLADQFTDALGPLLGGDQVVNRRRVALAIHLTRAAVEMAIHVGDAKVIEDFKRNLALAANIPATDRRPTV